MLRKILVLIKFIGRRRKWCVPLLVWALLSVVTFTWLGEVASRALRPPPPPRQDLHHFWRNNSLEHYLDNINLLIEPSSVPCSHHIPVITLVSSISSHVEQRQAIRNSWGKLQLTYFVLGIQGDNVDENLVDNYVEAKQYSDMIVYDFRDHYQNLTLKTALMLQWTLGRCPLAKYMFKTDDDVLVNPWTLGAVLDDHPDADLLGYRKVNAELHRDEYTKWFVPRWLLRKDIVPEYLSGTGYLIKVDLLQKILATAKKVPLMNLEDVYLTYLVSHLQLKLKLSHDQRLSPYKPWLSFSCAFWTRASYHSLKPREISHAWEKIYEIGQKYQTDKEVCSFFKKYLDSEFFLY